MCGRGSMSSETWQKINKNETNIKHKHSQRSHTLILHFKSRKVCFNQAKTWNATVNRGIPYYLSGVLKHTVFKPAALYWPWVYFPRFHSVYKKVLEKLTILTVSNCRRFLKTLTVLRHLELCNHSYDAIHLKTKESWRNVSKNFLRGTGLVF